MRIAHVGLLAMFLFRGCDLGTPEQVSQQFQPRLAEFFPQAQVQYDESKRMFIGVTCIRGTSEAFAAKIAQLMAYDPSYQQAFQQLDTANLGRSLSGKPAYKFVAIGFEHEAVYYSIDTHQTTVQPQSDEWTTWYRQKCGF